MRKAGVGLICRNQFNAAIREFCKIYIFLSFQAHRRLEKQLANFFPFLIWNQNQRWDFPISYRHIVTCTCNLMKKNMYFGNNVLENNTLICENKLIGSEYYIFKSVNITKKWKKLIDKRQDFSMHLTLINQTILIFLILKLQYSIFKTTARQHVE